MADDDYEDSNDSERPGALTTPTRQNQIARQDFSGTSIAVGSASTDALVAKSRADTEARWIMAMRNPRNLDVVRQSIMEECRRPAFADVATYARPIGKEKNKDGDWVEKYAEGLSIRFAEVAMRCMSNMSCKAQTVYDDASVRLITVTAVDYQGNATWEIDLSIPKTVERRQLKKGQKPLGERLNSYGDRVFIVQATDQDVATKAAAEISKAARTCILRLVPGNLQDEAFTLCHKVAADRDAKDPKAARNRMMDAFGTLGVSPANIEEWIGRPVDGITKAEGEALLKIHSAIREGETTWADVLAERLTVLEAARKKPTSDAKPAAAAPEKQASIAPVEPASEAKVAPAEPQAKAAAAPRSSSTGKGVGALKGALTQQAPVASAPKHVELPPDTPPPAAGSEYRACAGCGVVVEVPIGAPAGQKCYVCSSAERDAE